MFLVWERSNSALSCSSENPSSEPSCGGGAPVCSSRSYSSSSDDVSVLLIRLMLVRCYCRCRKIYNLKVRRSWLCVVLWLGRHATSKVPPLGLHQTKISPGLAFLGAKTKPAKIFAVRPLQTTGTVETNKITGVVIWLLLHSHLPRIARHFTCSDLATHDQD